MGRRARRRSDDRRPSPCKSVVAASRPVLRRAGQRAAPCRAHRRPPQGHAGRRPRHGRPPLCADSRRSVARGRDGGRGARVRLAQNHHRCARPAERPPLGCPRRVAQQGPRWRSLVRGRGGARRGQQHQSGPCQRVRRLVSDQRDAVAAAGGAGARRPRGWRGGGGCSIRPGHTAPRPRRGRHWICSLRGRVSPSRWVPVCRGGGRRPRQVLRRPRERLPALQLCRDRGRQLEPSRASGRGGHCGQPLHSPGVAECDGGRDKPRARLGSHPRDGGPGLPSVVRLPRRGASCWRGAHGSHSGARRVGKRRGARRGGCAHRRVPGGQPGGVRAPSAAGLHPRGIAGFCRTRGRGGPAHGPPSRIGRRASRRRWRGQLHGPLYTPHCAAAGLPPPPPPARCALCARCFGLGGLRRGRNRGGSRSARLRAGPPCLRAGWRPSDAARDRRRDACGSPSQRPRCGVAGRADRGDVPRASRPARRRRRAGLACRLAAAVASFRASRRRNG
mmetsp:Transcript_13543/g.51701  ORF Transcript_13543/g.51701 Transcript_13543/m.51701 type:complete len:503 (+) Transcript_13543:1405-2913(+)